MNALLLPVLIPLLGAVACLFMRSSPPRQRLVSGLCAVAVPVAAVWMLLLTRHSGPQVLRIGLWPETFGIVLAVDMLGAIMVCLSAAAHFVTFLYTISGAATSEEEGFLLHPAFLFLVSGVNWAFSTGDLFNLFVSFEILLLASYVLISYGNGRAQLRESTKFVVLNMISSAIFLAAAGFAYGVFGTLNMAELALRIQQAAAPAQTALLGTLMLFVFGFKAALFPMFFWLPHSYPKAPVAVLAYFAGILTKVGVYCLYRVFTLLFRDEHMMTAWFQPLILAIGGATMLVGVLGALSQSTMRRILSFHIISQIGYMIFGLGIFTPLSLAFGVFYIVHHIIVKASLFLVAGCVVVNEGTDDLKKVHGLLTLYPMLAILFLLASLSLAGIPPLSGFFGKYGLVVEGFAQGHYFYAGVSILTGLLTLISMMKIWRLGFWGEVATPHARPRPRNGAVIAATGVLVGLSVFVAVFSGPLMKIALEAGEELLDRRPYIGAVLGARGVAALEAPPAGLPVTGEGRP